MPLQTRICEILEIEYPIFLAGMGGASVPALAAAVSNAGGLGVLGAAACSPDQLRSWIRQTREMTDKPFGVDTLLPASVRRGMLQQRCAPQVRRIWARASSSYSRENSSRRRWRW